MSTTVWERERRDFRDDPIAIKRDRERDTRTHHYNERKNPSSPLSHFRNMVAEKGLTFHEGCTERVSLSVGQSNAIVFKRVPACWLHDVIEERGDFLVQCSIYLMVRQLVELPMGFGVGSLKQLREVAVRTARSPAVKQLYKC